MFRSIILAIVVGGLLGMVIGVLCSVGCTRNKVSFDSAEDSRRQVRDNVSALANAYRAENKLADFDLYIRGDSTVSMDCPQGDGWASIDLKNPKTGDVIKLKCSTVSAGIGCMTDADFKTKAYAKEDGVCNRDLPFPLPKVVK